MSHICAHLFISLLFSLFYFILIVYGENISLSIADGKIVGQANSTIKNNVTFYSFRGIPFAKPPLGNLRFANPAKNDPWNGTWDATRDKDQCLQFDGDEVVGNEDCLYLNVYSTNYSNAANLPVLFWIYGGGFAAGNNSYELYSPDYFVEKSLIVVTVNYRLGVLGFLSTEDAACPGNWGIKDQILALKWVQENIKYFGGDPNKVTIFGESAGAVSVNLLLQTNLTKGLFKGAILNSGSTLMLWALNTRAKKIATSTGLALGIFTSNSTTLVAKLREIRAQNLIQTASIIGQTIFIEDGLLRGLPFAPVMEPNVEGAVYVKPSETALQSGQFSQVPVLMGFNSQEAAALGESLPGLLGLLRLYFLTYDVHPETLSPWSMTKNSTKRLEAGIDIKQHYFGNNLIAADVQGLINFFSADIFNRPIRKAATDMAKFSTVYFYVFGYEGNVSAVTADRNFSGAAHGEDLPYLFSALYSKSTTTDLKVSETMVLLWSNFAKFGNPTPYQDDKLNGTIWASVDPKSTNFNYLVLNESISMSTNPKQSDWVFYTNLWQKYGDITPITTY